MVRIPRRKQKEHLGNKRHNCINQHPTVVQLDTRCDQITNVTNRPDYPEASGYVQAMKNVDNNTDREYATTVLSAIHGSRTDIHSTKLN